MSEELKQRDKGMWPRRRREWYKYRANVEPFNSTRGIWIATISALTVSAMMILFSYSTRRDSFSPFLNPLYLTISNNILYNLLYAFDFWTQRRSFTSQIQSEIVCITGSVLITFNFAFLSFKLEKVLFHRASFPLPTFFTAALMAGVTAYLMTQLLKNINQRQRIIIENEQLQTENLLSRYQTLQQQVRPHFLFNTLNTLDGLVGNDDEGARKYIAQLADIIRYTMNKPQEVTLEDELAFTRAYLYMMQIRYGAEQLKVEERVDPTFLAANLPAISVQMLVENAIKHNIISKRHPLSISIHTTEDGQLVVSNAFQPRVDREKSDNGTGLHNLATRYRLRYHREISVLQDEKTFSVTIPLIIP
ncbi:MAG: histidine kinase [Bacteroidales bacterium]|nr:histidine kinase [Bacteroidales bacterium]